MKIRHVGRIKGNPEAEEALRALRKVQDEIDQRTAFLEKQVDVLKKEKADAWKAFFTAVKKFGHLPEEVTYDSNEVNNLYIGKGEEDLFLVDKEPVHPIQQILGRLT